MIIDAIVPAAGIGSRMGASVPKQYLDLSGVSVLERTIRLLLSLPSVGKVIVPLKADDDIFDTLPIASESRVVRTEGGKERVDSVLAGLRLVSTEWVLVHDAARPCVDPSDIQRLIDDAVPVGGGILAMKTRDTMKRVGADGAIEETVDRSCLYHALTPQLFRTAELNAAIICAQKAGILVTDESSAMEAAGFRPLPVEGRPDNIKITRPGDLELAAFILSKRGEL